MPSHLLCRNQLSIDNQCSVVTFSGGHMFKKNIGIPIIMFIFLAGKQSLFNDEIQWIQNGLFSIFLYVVYMFWEWASVPFDWGKKK